MNPKELGRIGVLAGGPSNEREISLLSGQAVFAALKDAGADAVFIDVRSEGSVIRQLSEAGIDMAFIALHGRFGEDGIIQKILEDSDIPYTGSGPAASRFALDKIISLELFSKNGISVPAHRTFSKKTFSEAAIDPLAQTLGLPLVVKPQFEGSSIGISIVRDTGGLKTAIDMAFGYGDNIIVEEYIKGRELTVGILDDKPMDVIEVVVREEFYNFDAKYKRADTQYIVPAQISQGHYKMAQRYGKSAHTLLGCDFFSRVDMILDENQGKMYVLEVNSIPGLTSHSLLPKAAAYSGITFNELCLRIAGSALKKARIVRIGQKNKKI